MPPTPLFLGKIKEKISEMKKRNFVRRLEICAEIFAYICTVQRYVKRDLQKYVQKYVLKGSYACIIQTVLCYIMYIHDILLTMNK